MGGYFQGQDATARMHAPRTRLPAVLDYPDRSVDRGGAGATTGVMIATDASVLKCVLPENDEEDTDVALAGTLDLPFPSSRSMK